MDAIVTVPEPVNEPVRGYAPGSPERDSLEARLKGAPEDADGWVRLVRAYAVLGRTADRERALAAAKARFAARPEVLAALEAAARTPAGL